MRSPYGNIECHDGTLEAVEQRASSVRITVADVWLFPPSGGERQITADIELTGVHCILKDENVIGDVEFPGGEPDIIDLEIKERVLEVVLEWRGPRFDAPEIHFYQFEFKDYSVNVREQDQG